MNHSNQDSGDEFTALAGFYQLLQRLWQSEVDAPLLAQLQDGPLAEVAGELKIPLDDGPPQQVLEELAVSYCQLLIGPANHVPPYQSVWSDGQLQSAATTSMRSYLEIVGEQPTDSSLVDHLGIQLQVMMRIVSELAAAQPESDRYRELQALACRFYHEHLTWPGKFLATAQQATDSPFYRAVARVTAEFLEQEEKYWSDTLAATSLPNP